jgi:hypothetical protein
MEMQEEIKKEIASLFKNDPVQLCCLLAATLNRVCETTEFDQITLIGNSEKGNGKEEYPWGMFFSTDHDLIKKTKKLFSDMKN